MKEIARSFSMTKQVKPYEPISVFASYKTEVEDGEDEERISEELYQRARRDVENAIKEYTAPETTKEELSVLESNLNATQKELEIAKRLPKENAGLIADKKFEINLLKGLIKQLKNK